jgi:D-glycero-D-manno-heptose 1,7-bisphosphate phosphatase
VVAAADALPYAGVNSARRAVLLDRDGVINRADVLAGKPLAPATLGDLSVLPGVPESLIRLRQAGYLTLVVTNQPDVGKGTVRRDVVEAMHAKLARELALDGIYVCYHVAEDRCSCRKPEPGMLLAAAGDWKVDLASSWMVGDRWRDVGAGRAAGTRTIWIDCGYDEPRAESPDWIVRSLPEAVEIILGAAGTSSSLRRGSETGH